MDDAGEPRPGQVAPEIAAELPGLRLRWLVVRASAGASPPGLRARLRRLSDRGRGIDAVAMRTRPVPRAFRACFRQLGLDPDVDRIPAERAVVDRLLHGGWRAGDAIADACLLAVVETGVGVWALDAAAVDAERLSIQVGAAGGLVVADGSVVHAELFGDVPPGSAPDAGTRSVLLFAVGVDGVPEIHLHEALWLAADALSPATP